MQAINKLLGSPGRVEGLHGLLQRVCAQVTPLHHRREVGLRGEPRRGRSGGCLVAVEPGCGQPGAGSQREGGPEHSPQAGQHLWDGGEGGWCRVKMTWWRTTQQARLTHWAWIHLKKNNTHTHDARIQLRFESIAHQHSLHLDAAWVYLRAQTHTRGLTATTTLATLTTCRFKLKKSMRWCDSRPQRSNRNLSYRTHLKSMLRCPVRQPPQETLEDDRGAAPARIRPQRERHTERQRQGERERQIVQISSTKPFEHLTWAVGFGPKSHFCER